MNPADLHAVMNDFVARDYADIGNEATASAIQACVWESGDVVFEDAVGVAQFEPTRPFSTSTPLDLASVTKVFTATLAMQAVDQGLAALDQPIASWVAEWDDQEFEPVTLLHLMNHSSGLPAWEQYYLRYPIQPDLDTAAQTADAIEAEIVATKRRAPGIHGVYSDLGYILLGRIVERIFDDVLEDLVEKQIAERIGLESIRYVSQRRGDAAISSAAATEIDPRRGGVMVGRVHDENCFIQGGVAGHAGLFGVASDVARFGQHLLDVDGGATGIVTTETLRTCWSEAAKGGDGHHLGGWDTPSGATSSAGGGFSPDATVGHLGFTGTSIWIERSQKVVAALLSNRVYPTRENALIKPLRVAFHEAVLPPSA